MNSVPRSYRLLRRHVTRFTTQWDFLPPATNSRRPEAGSRAAARRKHTTWHANALQCRVDPRGGVEERRLGDGTILLISPFSLLTAVTSTAMWLPVCARAKGKEDRG
jgi:hypothetical protein